MASLQSLQARRLSDKYLAVRIVDDPTAIRLKYVGGGSVTSVTMTTATDVTLVTVSGGVTYTDAYLWEDYVTMGDVADAINNDQRFEAKVVNALRGDATGTDVFVTGTKTITADGYYDLTSDTTYTKNLTARLSFDNDPLVTKLEVDHRVHLWEIKTQFTVGGTYTFKVYECDPRGGKETMIWQTVPTVGGTAASITWASGEGRITARPGCDLVAQLVDDTSITGNLTLVGVAE